ncbi:hypothetical protein ACU8KH_00115 [Lachancea thermotolerans]
MVSEELRPHRWKPFNSNPLAGLRWPHMFHRTQILLAPLSFKRPRFAASSVAFVGPFLM